MVLNLTSQTNAANAICTVGKKAVRREQLYLRRQRIPAKDHKYNEIGIITADPKPQMGWARRLLVFNIIFSPIQASRNHLLGQGDKD